MSISKIIFVAAALACANVALAEKLGDVVNVEFTSTHAPLSWEESVSTYTNSNAVVTYSSGQVRQYPLKFKALFRSGDKIGRNRAGQVTDVLGRELLTAESEKGEVAKGPFYSFAPDANSLIQQNGKLYLLTHYEYHTEVPAAGSGGPVQLYGQLPMGMSLSAIRQDRRTGALSATQIDNVDMRGINGLWIPCAASLSPWNTHLAGEEYEPNAQVYEHEPLEVMNLYRNTLGKRADAGGANAYDYGHLVEVKIEKNGKATPVKHLAMGRYSGELAEIMPDERTAYMGDDGRDTVQFMFVADQARDMSAGTLYAARWEQVSAVRGGKAKFKWVRLGHASDAEVRAYTEKGIKFSDIFEVAGAAEVKATPQKYADYKPFFAYEGKSPANNGQIQEVVYLRVKPGMDQAAAFLESRRYAAIKGATTEFTKMEGVTVNPEDRRLYLAMSYIEKGMLDGQNDVRPRDDIRLEGDPDDLKCGAVYEQTLRGGQNDTDGQPINSEWVANATQALVLGARKKVQRNLYSQYDSCDTELMANPDGIKYSSEMRTLFIGEDSGNHLNNFLWAYNVDNGNLTRILSAPIGAELTGLQIVPNLNGHSYVMSNVQHPAATEDLRRYPKKISSDLRAKTDRRGVVGYLEGLPDIRR